MRFNAKKNPSKWWELVYTCFSEKKTTFLNLLIKDSDDEDTKRQRKYAVSRMYLKN